jgi:hypothetical protein
MWFLTNVLVDAHCIREIWNTPGIFYSLFTSVADPYLCLTNSNPDPTPDPAIFVSELQDGKKKVFCQLLFVATFT